MVDPSMVSGVGWHFLLCAQTSKEEALEVEFSLMVNDQSAMAVNEISTETLDSKAQMTSWLMSTLDIR